MFYVEDIMADCIAYGRLLKWNDSPAIESRIDNLITYTQNEKNVEFLIFCCLSEM